ncbi:hypothetical protein BKA82DRAFT_4049032, partial [Pisolithus tinctorius]
MPLYNRIILRKPRRLFHRVLLLLNMSLYGTADIRSWHSLIRNNPLTSDCQVIGVGWYKKRKGVEHEFLRFDISSPDNQHTCIVIAERSGGGVRSPNSDATQAADTIAQMDTAVDATASPLTPPETSALSPDVGDSTASSADESSPPLDKKMNTAQIAASLSSSSKRDAYDRVYFATHISAAGAWVEEMCDRPRLACTLSFTGAKPTANELATLLYVTSAQEPKYNLHDTQCYWFAATVFDALKTLYKGPEQDPTPNLGGYNLWGTGRFQGKRGRGVRQVSRGIEQQCRLKQEQKEQRQREREQRQAAEEAAKRAEEERRAAEERAQAAEEERQKECQATEEAAKWEREQRDPAEERAWAAEEANAKFSSSWSNFVFASSAARALSSAMRSF